MYSARISEPASKDINSIAQYISDILKNPAAAGRLLDLFEKGIRELKKMPLKYPEAADEYLALRKIRGFAVKNYMIFYRVDTDNKTVIIIRVLYARSSWKDLLKFK